MIIASLENSSRIEPLHPSFKKVFDYLKSTDFTTLEEGKFPIDEHIVLSIATIMGKERCEAPLETHHKYIDIQMPINTTETYGWKPLSELTALSVPYDIDKDISFFDDCPSVFVPVDPGNFIIFFPEDAHAPGIGNVPIKKIVVKIKL